MRLSEEISRVIITTREHFLLERRHAYSTDLFLSCYLGGGGLELLLQVATIYLGGPELLPQVVKIEWALQSWTRLGRLVLAKEDESACSKHRRSGDLSDG